MQPQHDSAIQIQSLFAPNREEVSALKILSNRERHATDHPEAPSAQVLRRLHEVPSGVIAALPDRENIRKQIQRQHLKDMPANLMTMQDSGEVPEKYKKMKAGENFLLYDSLADETYNLNVGRILIFATGGNLKKHMKCPMWFVDGTFKTAPAIFFQLLAILGSVTQLVHSVEQKLALSLVYALLESKKESAYSNVFEVVSEESRRHCSQSILPQFIMSDFEPAIINSAKKYFGEDNVLGAGN